MTTFGDFTAADEIDDAPADPVAVARILVDLLHDRDPERFLTWEGHSSGRRAVWIDAVGALLARMRREGTAR